MIPRKRKLLWRELARRYSQRNLGIANVPLHSALYELLGGDRMKVWVYFANRSSNQFFVLIAFRTGWYQVTSG
jgi:hypothetical protein